MWRKAAIGGMLSRSRWLCKRLPNCWASTPTCLLLFQTTLPRHSSSATRRHPVSQPTNGTPTTSWTFSISTAWHTPRRWGTARRRCTRLRIHPSAWRPGCSTTTVSSARLYWESKLAFFAPKGVAIPVAVSAFPDELYQAPRSWTERAYPKLIHYNKLDTGGHFAAWEQPQLFSEEVRAGFRSLR